MYVLRVEGVVSAGKPVPVGEGDAKRNREFLFGKQGQGGIGESEHVDMALRVRFFFYGSVIVSPVPAHIVFPLSLKVIKYRGTEALPEAVSC